MKNYLRIIIRTKVNTFEWRFGEQVLKKFFDTSNLLEPEMVSHNPDRFYDLFVGETECETAWAPMGKMFVDGSVYEFYDDFALKRKNKIKYVFHVNHKTLNNRSQIVPGTISLRSDFSEEVNWYSLFEKWCGVFSPQLGLLHLFSGPELDPSKKNKSFQLGSFRAALKPEIPNAGWAMFYGNEFAKELDFQGIAKAGFPVKKIGDGYLVLVTENIQDILNDFPMFSNRRSVLKSFFKDDFFLVKEEPAYQ